MHEVDTQVEVPLSACRAGEHGEVVFVDGDTNTACRLRELGIEAGATVRIAREGSPVILHVHGTRLCLRSELADFIFVRLAQAISPAPLDAELAH